MLGTKRRLPSFLQGVTLWNDLVETVDEELTLFKETSLDPKKNFFNPRALSTIKDLRDLNRFFGFTVDLTFLEDKYGVDDQAIIDYLRSEAENMILKVRSKGTAEYHRYIFNRVSEPGFVYVMFHDSQYTDRDTFYRALNYFDPLKSQIQDLLLEHDFSQPFTEVIPLDPFPDGFLVLYGLDHGDTLDQSPPWTFDYSLFGQSVTITKHLAAEFMANKTYTVGSDTFLITDKQFEYLRKSMSFGRKAVEISHAGLNISAYTKTDEVPFTVSDIDVTTVVTASWVANDRSNLNNLYNTFSIGAYEVPIAASQIYTDEFFDVVNLTMPGNKIYPEIAATGNGTNTSFGFTLDYPRIDPGTVVISYTDTSSNKRTIIDDGNGNLYYPDLWSGQELGLDFASGTINYETGACVLNTIDTSGTAINVTPGGGESLIASYYSFFGLILDTLSIKNNSGTETVNISFPDVQIRNKEYHLSFLVVIDRRNP